MGVKEDIKILPAKEAMTMTKLAQLMTEETGQRYTMKSISDKLARKTLRYEEFITILNIMDYKMELKKVCKK